MIYAVCMCHWYEGINYLEHYGLRRTKDENGIYESIAYQHSWSAHSNHVSFRIQRHADHHAHSFRPYQILRRFDKTPTLPFDYLLMYQLAFVPPLFFMIMDPRVDAINDVKKGKVNLNAWNLAQPLSEIDKKNHRIAYIYFACVFILIAFLTLLEFY